MTCQHKSHAAYREALEELYLHAYLAQKDLSKLVDEAEAHTADPVQSRGMFMLQNEHRVTDVEERLAHGRQRVADAQAVVDKHMPRCGLVKVPA